MSSLKILFLMLCMTLVSCTGQRTGKEDDNNDGVTIEVEEIKFPPQDILQLKSYYMSSSVHVDSTDYLIGYNYGSSSNLVVISFLFQLSSSFLILLKVVDMFAF